ncbi:uncharacterized protein N7518_010413 [Penicillium psychrosexuale]|uniref:uncharacterized protein n=1 Tax=Penicillium psychrosexuale TaxID=1002107 RepID=UPI002545A580|nr:uncharacterized protein N7518_010413 [Penicillium psychrosexuale]KAJ5781930.1 hypothetical protein N7518_010413 [Penicillium psychrosexuale]
MAASMSALVLETPRYPELNLLVYDSNGHLLAALEIPTTQQAQYITEEMLCRYCWLVFIFPNQNEWAIYKLQANNTPDTTALQHDSASLVSPGNYVVLDLNHAPITIDLTPNYAPRRVRTQSADSQSQGQREWSRLQNKFRDSLRTRDAACAITGPNAIASRRSPFRGLEATHIFPVSKVDEWRRNQYRRYITDTRPSSEIGESGLYSPQNGLLLRSDIHIHFDAFEIGIDADADYKIIVFVPDTTGIGGTRLRNSALSGTLRVSANLLRWHLRMCLYKHLKANAEPQTEWEEDLGEDPMGEILSQPDAAERMEVELFTRLGELIE